MTEPIMEQYTDKEAEKIRDYVEKYYSTKVPPPRKPEKEDLSFWRLAGFEAVSFSIPAFAMVLFSAIRTGGFFFVLEQKLLTEFGMPKEVVWVFSFIIMFAALLGFEGYALARGMKSGRDTMVVKENKWGTIFTFIIIVCVGIFSGLGLIKDIPETLQLIINVFMAVITGLGAGIITFFGGSDIGIAIKKFDLERIRIQSQYQTLYDGWYEKAVASYLSVKARSGKQINQQQPSIQTPSNQNISPKEKDWRKASVSFSMSDYMFLANMNKQEREKVAQEREFDVKTAENWQKNAQRWLLINYIETNKSFPSTDIISSFGMTSKDVSKFIISNKDKLLRQGLVTEEIIKMAEEALIK